LEVLDKNHSQISALKSLSENVTVFNLQKIVNCYKLDPVHTHVNSMVTLFESEIESFIVKDMTLVPFNMIDLNAYYKSMNSIVNNCTEFIT